MKKLLMCLLCVLLPAIALGETETKTLDWAFGLFSVEIPASWTAGPMDSNILADLRCDISELAYPTYASFASLQEYDSTARSSLDSRVSLLFALGGGGEYTETEITEETLPNGIRLRWQLMRGDGMHTLWFEAFSERFGYNMTLSGQPAEEVDAVLLAIMRSFRADAAREQDVLEIRQGKLAGGAFISAEHGLQLQLDEDWNEVTIPDLRVPQTAFALEKGNGRWLIQLMYVRQWESGEARALLEAYMAMRGCQGLGEPEKIPLEGLGGIDAWTVIEQSGICMQHIAFVHEGYGYYGSFMWIVPDDETARPYMDEAIRSLTKPE